nr:hypothetical protein [Candidatus Microthrix sp.]
MTLSGCRLPAPLDQLLVAALGRAVPGGQVDVVAVLVGDRLHLDVGAW